MVYSINSVGQQLLTVETIIIINESSNPIGAPVRRAWTQRKDGLYMASRFP